MTTDKEKPGKFKRISAIGRIAFGVLLGLIGMILAVGGVWLAALGGSLYYAVAGLLLMSAGLGFCLGRPFGFHLYAAAFIFTLVWAIWEAGFNGWALTPRLAGP